jgi:hypothetical protein
MQQQQHTTTAKNTQFGHCITFTKLPPVVRRTIYLVSIPRSLYVMIDKFLDSLNQLSNEEYQLHTFTGCKPVRTGKRNMPDEISIYSSQMTARTIDLTTDDHSTSASMYSTTPPRNGKRTYIDVTKGLQKSETSTPSLMSAPTMAASPFSELDDKIRAAIEQMHENTKIMDVKQQAKDTEKMIVDLRFQDLTDKLGSVVDIVKEASEGQVRLQSAMEIQQTQLNRPSGIIQEWMKQRQGEHSVGPASPVRKKRTQHQEEESMDESPSSQA